MKLPILSRGVRGEDLRHLDVKDGILPQGCSGVKHRLCNIRAAACLLTLPAGPEAFAGCLAAIGASDCYDCWFP
jgi:hypothetical protein